MEELLVEATDEVGAPTNIATLAIIMTMVPMAFVGGMMGSFMKPIPLNVPVALLASLVVAYIFTPYLSLKLLKKPTKINTIIKEKNEWVCKVYLYIINSRFKKFIVIVLTAVAFFASLMMFPTKLVLAKMLPGKSDNTYSIFDTPTGSSIEQTRQLQSVLRIS